MKIKAFLIITTAAALLIITGCEQPQKTTQWDKLTELERERTDLKQEVKHLQQENKQLKEQFASLAKLEHDIRVELLANLDNVEIDKRSGFFDKNRDGKEETLIVYLKPFDDSGDVIKAAGDVNIQLWDLSKKSDDALLGEWNIAPKELKDLWMGMVMTNYYRLSFRIPELLDGNRKDLTIKVKFTDYLTGKVFRKQKVVKCKP